MKTSLRSPVLTPSSSLSIKLMVLPNFTTKLDIELSLVELSPIGLQYSLQSNRRGKSNIKNMKHKVWNMESQMSIHSNTWNFVVGTSKWCLPMFCSVTEYNRKATWANWPRRLSLVRENVLILSCMNVYAFPYTYV